MVPTEHTNTGAASFDRFFRRVEDRLVPLIGPAHVGPYDEDVHELDADDACPICGIEMSHHRIERETENAVLICPVEVQPVANDTAPLNELGMPTDAARRRAAKHDGGT